MTRALTRGKPDSTTLGHSHTCTCIPPCTGLPLTSERSRKWPGAKGMTTAEIVAYHSGLGIHFRGQSHFIKRVSAWTAWDGHSSACCSLAFHATHISVAASCCTRCGHILPCEARPCLSLVTAQHLPGPRLGFRPQFYAFLSPPSVWP